MPMIMGCKMLTYQQSLAGVSSAKAQGVIEAIRVENFMCHKNLYLALNSRVNFITGRNGSGKRNRSTSTMSWSNSF